MIFKFFAGFSDVIRLSLALAAEVLLAFLTSYSEFTHVHSCLFGNRLSYLILSSVVYYSRHDLHNILTTARHKVGIL
jgi:hypothetical protein